VKLERFAAQSQEYGLKEIAKTNVDLRSEEKHLDHAAHPKRMV